MLWVLPLAVFGLLYAAVYRWQRDWRATLLIASTVWATLVTLITETLSQFRGLTAAGLAESWLLAAVAAGAFLLRRPPPPPADGAPSDGRRLPGWPWLLVSLLLGLWLIFLGIVALTAAPNTYDAMTYHLPRVMHWIQNRHVGHYPTAIQRQIYLGPWPAYAILQFQLLLGTDQLANLVQWIALVACVAGASLIARQLGASVPGQILTAVLVATAPMAVLQSTSPQTDLVAACWLVATVGFVLAALEANPSGRAQWLYVVLAGLALGHGLLTKATIYFFGLAPCLWLAAALGRRLRLRAVAPLAVFGLLVLAVNLPTYIRQIRTYGSPFGPGEESADGPSPAAPYGSAIHTPGAIVSTLLRNAALELVTPASTLTDRLTAGIRALHRWLGLDPDDLRTTWVGNRFDLNTSVWANENFAGNPLHFLLVLAAGVALAVRPPPASAYARIYFFILLCGGVFFCAMLRWTIWSTRLHLPLLVLGTPLVGLALSRSARGWPAGGLAWLALGLAVPVALHNTSRPLVGPNAYYRLDRIEQYYLSSGPELAEIHRKCVEAVRALHGTQIGLRLGRDDWEYPLWLRLRAAGLRPRLEHVDVTNPSAKARAAVAPFSPDLTITIQLEQQHVSVFRGRGGR